MIRTQKNKDVPIDIKTTINIDSLLVRKWAKDYLKYILIDEGLIKKRIEKLAYEITKEFKLDSKSYQNAVERNKKNRLVMLTVLEGAKKFSEELASNIEGKIEQVSIKISSYKKTSSLHIEEIIGLKYDIRGRDVVLVEDIVDTGKTLSYLVKTLLEKKPRKLRTICLLDKRERREINIHADYTGFYIPNEFVVGFGLDFEGSYRNLPFVAVLKKY